MQFAVMGSVLASVADNIKNPKVYLLNIGEEEIKGNEQVKQAAQMLSNLSVINYRGYIEGDTLFTGEADVVVCEGFVGNVALKTTEGVAKLIARILKEAFMRNIFTKFVALLAIPMLKAVTKRIDPANYNGATFIGLQGNVIKSHGGAKVRSFARAIEEALICAEKNVPELIKHEVESYLRKASDNV